jgi:hypothetical protein
MKLLVIYRPNSEHGRLTEEFIERFKSHGSSSEHVEAVNIDSREGSALATLYDIMQYPAILVLRNDGSPQKVWVGDNLPQIDEVQAYLIA